MSPRREVRAALLVNTRSRQGRALYARAHRLLLLRKVRLVDVQPVLRPARLEELARSALSQGANRLVVGGGDGTVSAVVQALRGCDAELGVLPLGTGNDFARAIGLPIKDLEAACDVIAGGKVARVDLGVVNDRTFLNAASVGLTAAVARRLTGTFKRRLGALAYPLASLAEAWKLKPFEVRVRVAGAGFQAKVYQVVVGNGRYHGGGNLIAPGAGLQDGKLDVYLVLAAPAPALVGSRWRKLALLAGVGWRLKRGAHLEDPNVWHLRTTECEISARPARTLNVDGELIGRTPGRFSVAPRALRVLVP